MALLPEKFYINDREVNCKDRDLFMKELNNVCIFETPIEIPPGETTLRSQLFTTAAKFWASYNPDTISRLSKEKNTMKPKVSKSFPKKMMPI